jgi:AcrR family transcriptional regulator
MSIADSRRAAALEKIADHLLAEGLPGASLRALAAAAGTSDRMLLYYFADKDELLTAALLTVAARMAAQLEAICPLSPPRPWPALLLEIAPSLRTGALRPYMRLWLELAAGAAPGTQPQQQIARLITDGFLAWTAARIAAPREAARNQAALVLALVDGMALLDTTGDESIVASAIEAIKPLRD